jgi:uncharacterized protein
MIKFSVLESNMNLKKLASKAFRVHAENKKFINRLKKTRPNKLDEITHLLHKDAFNNISCLDCANCCSSISPMITDNDIARIAKFLKMKPSVLMEKHLHLDNDQDYVFNITPCPFLMKDNFCSIYNARPKACREYPHTDRKHFYQILDLTLKNTFICPAVFEIVENLKREIS